MSGDTLIREVDEELQRDRMRKLWRLAAPFVIGGAILIIVGVAGYEAWTWWQKTQAAKSSDQFYAATELANGTDLDAAKKALDEVIASSSGGYPMLAQFREAALLGQQGKTDDAVAAYDSLATSLQNTSLRELALVLAANLLVDKGDVAAVEQRVGGSMVPSSPMRNAAREVMGLTQYKAGKLDDAIKSFTDILNDPLAAQDTRNRVQLYVQQLLAEGAKPIAPPDQTASSAEPSAQPSAPVSSAASTAVDASTQLDVSVPVVDTTAPSASAEASAASSAVSSASEPVSSVSAPSSSAP